jgi:hypothetical protein
MRWSDRFSPSDMSAILYCNWQWARGKDEKVVENITKRYITKQFKNKELQITILKKSIH